MDEAKLGIAKTLLERFDFSLDRLQAEGQEALFALEDHLQQHPKHMRSMNQLVASHAPELDWMNTAISHSEFLALKRARTSSVDAGSPIP